MFEKVLEFLATKEVYSETEVYYTPTLAGNIALILLVLLIFIAMTAFTGMQIKLQVKQLAFSAMAVTLAVVAAIFKIVELPYGGSITIFSMLFICFIGYLYGTRVGILTGIAFGFINLILGPTILHPVQMLLDYPIAYGCLGLAGVFSKSKYGLLKGYILGVFGRYVCHVLTGFIFFYMYAPEGTNALVYSLGYNATYIVPEAFITILLLFIPSVHRALNEVKRMAAE